MSNNPFDNETWIRMCLKTGAITPPRGSDVEKLNKYTMFAVWFVVVTGAAISWLAFAWR